MAPSRWLRHVGYWHLQEHGETDSLLVMAVHTIDAGLCPCGCGQQRKDAHDEATQGRWQVSVDKCYASEALREFGENHREELADSLLSLTLLPVGQSAIDPLEFSPERAAAEQAALHARLGL